MDVLFWLLGLLYVIWKGLMWSKSKTWNEFKFLHALPIYTPIWNCQCQEESSSLIFAVNENPFETVKCADEVLRYTSQTKLPVPEGEFFADLCCQWEPIWSSQAFRWSAQIYPLTTTICQMKWPRSDVTWCTQIGCQIYLPTHNLSDEVTKIRCDMMYPDRLPDIPPENLSDTVTMMRCEMKYPDRLSDIPLWW